MTIPEIKERLLEIAVETGNGEIATLANELSRRPPVKRAKAKSPPMTPELALEIWEYARKNPTLSQVEIARHFGVNPGRVSEALRGKRK